MEQKRSQSHNRFETKTYKMRISIFQAELQDIPIHNPYIIASLMKSNHPVSSAQTKPQIQDENCDWGGEILTLQRHVDTQRINFYLYMQGKLVGEGGINIDQLHKYNDQFDLELEQKDKVIGTLKISISDEQIHREKNSQESDKLKRYLREQGIEQSFKIIFAEVLQKKVKVTDAFQYTADRLRQIGKDIDALRAKRDGTPSTKSTPSSYKDVPRLPPIKK